MATDVHACALCSPHIQYTEDTQQAVTVAGVSEAFKIIAFCLPPGLPSPSRHSLGQVLASLEAVYPKAVLVQGDGHMHRHLLLRFCQHTTRRIPR